MPAGPRASCSAARAAGRHPPHDRHRTRCAPACATRRSTRSSSRRTRSRTRPLSSARSRPSSRRRATGTCPASTVSLGFGARRSITRRARRRLRVGAEPLGADRASSTRPSPPDAREEAARDQHRRARHLGPGPRRLLARRARSTTRTSRSSRSRATWRCACARATTSFFLFSAGGYHPEFAVPASFPKLQRLKIILADSENLRLILTGYLAITSNTRQIGARDGVLRRSSASFSIEALLSFDALWEPDVRFLIDFDVEVKLKYKGMTFFGVDVSGRFTGPEPKRVAGRVVDRPLALLDRRDVRQARSATTGRRVALPAVDPLPALVAALKDAAATGARTSPRRRRSSPSATGATAQFVHPLGEARRAPAGAAARDRARPLRRRPVRRARGASPSRRRPSAGDAVTERPPVNEQFAAADFLDLTRRREARAAVVRGDARGRHARRRRRSTFGAAGRRTRRLGDRLRGDLRRRRRAAGRSETPERLRPARADVRRGLRRRRASQLAPRASASPRPGRPRGRRRALRRRGRRRPRAGAIGGGRRLTAAVHRRSSGTWQNPQAAAAAGRPAFAPRSRVSRATTSCRGCARAPRTRTTNADTLAPVLAAAGRQAAVRAARRAARQRRTPVDVPLRLYGPGDVIGIDPRAVLRTDPPRGTADFEPNYLACIEFDTPDFPWLFTPAAAGIERRGCGRGSCWSSCARTEACAAPRRAGRCRSSTRPSPSCPT